MNYIFLKNADLYGIQSHPLRTVLFDRYEASSAVLGTAILCKKGSQVAGLINVVDNSISKIVSLHIAVLVIATIGCT